MEDTAQLLLRAVSGATATIDLSWSYDNATDAYLQVYGSEGALRVGWRRSEFRTNADAEWVEFGSGYDKISVHASAGRRTSVARSRASSRSR